MNLILTMAGKYRRFIERGIKHQNTYYPEAQNHNIRNDYL